MSVVRADRRLGRWLRALPHAGILDDLLIALSRAQEHGGLWLALGAAGGLRDPRRRRPWARGALSVLLAEVLSQGVKGRVRRARPVEAKLPPLAPVPSRYSMPSAHTATAVAAVVGYRPLAPKLPLRAAALLTGLSRPYLGVHYPSDVLAGALVGSTTACAVRWGDVRLCRRRAG